MKAEINHLIDHESSAGDVGAPKQVERMGIVTVTDAADGYAVSASHQPPPLWRLTIMFTIIVMPLNIALFCSGIIPPIIEVRAIPL